MRYAKIESGSVINVQELEGTDSFDPAFVWVASAGASIGWLWDGTTLSAPPTAVIPLDTLKLAKSNQLIQETRDYVNGAYAPERQMTLSLLLNLAITGGRPNQRDYILQCVGWINAILTYHYARQNEITAAADAGALAGVSWDFAGTFDANDPKVTIRAAREITT